MKKLALFFLLLIPCVAFAQNVPYSDIVLSASGRPIAGAGISVCNSPGLATTAASVSSNLVTLTMASNPITAGFAANMTLQVSGFTGGDTYLNGGTLFGGIITGGFTILSVTSTTIVYPLSHANATATSNGFAFQQGNISTTCAPLAAITSDQAGVQPITQPGFASSNLGNYAFYAASAPYNVQFSGPGVATTLKPIAVAVSTANNNIFTATQTVTSIPGIQAVTTANTTSAQTVNAFSEGGPIPSNTAWNILFNLSQQDAGGGSVPSLPFYCQANPSGSQSGNTAAANWCSFETIKCQNFTANGAFLNCQGNEAEAFYTGALATPNNLQVKGAGGQVYIDNSTSATTASVPFGISGWFGAPYYSYQNCSSCGTGTYVDATSLRVEQPTASDSKGNAVGTGNRAAAEFTTNFANDPLNIEFQQIGQTVWNFGAHGNATACSTQCFDFALDNNLVSGNIGFRFQNKANGNVYVQANGSGQIVFNGTPVFSGEGGTALNGTSGAAFLPGGTGAPCAASTSGVVNFCNNTAVYARNAANSADLQVLNTDASNNTNLVTHGLGTALRVVNGASTPLFGFFDDGSSNGHFNIANLLFSNAAPTISSGFGTAPAIVFSNGTAALEVNVGTGGRATGGVLSFPAAANGWDCQVTDMNTNIVTRETAFTTTTVTLTAASAWSASDKLLLICFGF